MISDKFHTDIWQSERLVKIGFDPCEADMYYRDGKYYVGRFNPNTMASVAPIWSAVRLMSQRFANKVDYIIVANDRTGWEEEWKCEFVPEDNRDRQYFVYAKELPEALVKLFEMLNRDDKLWREDEEEETW